MYFRPSEERSQRRQSDGERSQDGGDRRERRHSSGSNKGRKGMWLTLAVFESTVALELSHLDLQRLLSSL